MFRIDMTEKVLAYDGKPLRGDADEDLTVRTIIAQAVNNLAFPGEQLTPEDKLKGFRISTHAFVNEVLEVSTSDAEFILRRSGAVHSPLMHGRLCDLLDPELAVPDEEPDTDDEKKTDEEKSGE